MQKIIKKVNSILNMRTLLILGLLILFSIFIIQSPKDNSRKKEISTSIPSTFTIGDFSKQGKRVTVSGTLKPIDSATLKAKMQGRITRLPIKAGDIIKRGDVVAEIKHDSLNAQLSIAEAEYARAQAEYKRQIVLLNSTQTQAEIGLKAAKVSKISSYNTASDNLNYAYKIAYDSAEQSLSGAITALTVLSDERLRWKQNNISSKATDALFSGANILLGANGTSALWNSSYLVRLKGGVRGRLENTDKEKINTIQMDETLNSLISGMKSIKKGLGFIRTITMISGTKQETSLIENEITQLNNFIAKITGSQKAISNARISLDATTQREDILSTQAKQTLNDSINSYVVSKISAKRAVESALARLVYAKNKMSDAFIRAPFDSIVTRKFASLGESATPGMNIISVASLSEWKAVFSAPDIFNEMITKDSEIDVSISGITGVFKSSISRIIPSAQQKSRRIIFEVDLPNLPKSTRDGMTVTATLKKGSGASASIHANSTFLLPNKFIGYDYDGAYVITKKGLNIAIKIRSRGVNNSIVSSSKLKNGITLNNPLIYTYAK